MHSQGPALRIARVERFHPSNAKDHQELINESTSVPTLVTPWSVNLLPKHQEVLLVNVPEKGDVPARPMIRSALTKGPGERRHRHTIQRETLLETSISLTKHEISSSGASRASFSAFFRPRARSGGLPTSPNHFSPPGASAHHPSLAPQPVL
jgi:hypothetical protein